MTSVVGKYTAFNVDELVETLNEERKKSGRNVAAGVHAMGYVEYGILASQVISDIMYGRSLDYAVFFAIDLDRIKSVGENVRATLRGYKVTQVMSRELHLSASTLNLWIVEKGGPGNRRLEAKKESTGLDRFVSADDECLHVDSALEAYTFALAGSWLLPIKPDKPPGFRGITPKMSELTKISTVSCKIEFMATSACELHVLTVGIFDDGAAENILANYSGAPMRVGFRLCSGGFVGVVLYARPSYGYLDADTRVRYVLLEMNPLY